MIHFYSKERRAIENAEWVRQSFMISHGVQIDSRQDDDEVKLRTRYFTTAGYKFTDTTLGGNTVINPHPQFTRSADIPVGSLYSGSSGQGRMYSEYIDDNKRYVTMNFGVPQFNSLSNFFQYFYDSQASALARTGRSSMIPYTIGRILGFVVSFYVWELMLISLASAAYKVAVGKPTSKFYYLKPTMPLYWNATSAICNEIAVKTGMVAIAIGGQYPTQADNRDILGDAEAREINQFYGMEMFDSFNPETGLSNGINIYAVATRAQRQARRAYKNVKDFYAASGGAGGDLNSISSDIANQIRSAADGAKTPSVTFESYLANWTAGPGEYQGGTSAEGGDGSELGGTKSVFNSDLFSETILRSKGKETTWTEFRDAELDDGAQYVSFRVENQNNASENFTNQVGESELANKINSISGQIRSTRNDLAHGNFGDGLIGSALGTLVQGASNVLMGFADQVGFGGLAALGGNAFADIPKNWQSSASRMPTMNYTVKLRTPYGNKFSRFINLTVPLAMLLAGALPLSTGRHSYTSPFICSLFDRGRAQTRLGIIDSINISRGTTNLAFNKIGEPLGIDVTFSVIDLSTVLHMPIAQGMGFDQLFTAPEDETMFQDYMSVLSALSLHEQIYFGSRVKLAVTRALKNLDSYFSIPHATNYFGGSLPGRIASIFYEGIVNR